MHTQDVRARPPEPLSGPPSQAAPAGVTGEVSGAPPSAISWSASSQPRRPKGPERVRPLPPPGPTRFEENRHPIDPIRVRHELQERPNQPTPIGSTRRRRDRRKFPSRTKSARTDPVDRIRILFHPLRTRVNRSRRPRNRPIRFPTRNRPIRFPTRNRLRSRPWRTLRKLRSLSRHSPLSPYNRGPRPIRPPVPWRSNQREERKIPLHSSRRQFPMPL